MNRVRIGVIGTGGMGSGHCRGLSKIDEAELTAVCDVSNSTLQAIKTEFHVPGFNSSTELLNSGLVDAVIIATPHYFHPPIAEAAFARGIHVLSEKPIGVAVSAADQMISAAERSGCKFAVMYQMRTLGRARLARQLIDDGRIGEIYRTSLTMAWYRSQAYYNSGGWRATWAGEGGGVLINQAPHFLDLFTWLGGMPLTISATTRTRMHDIEVEDEAFATLSYANGAHGYFYLSTMEAPTHEMFEICGDRGKIEMKGEDLRFWEIDGGLKSHCNTVASMSEAPPVREVPLEIPLTGGHHRDVTTNFCRAILFDEPLVSPGAEGIHALELINGAILSGHTGQTVNLPVDRSAYDLLLADLQSKSSLKTNTNEVRETDPHHVAA